MARKSRKKRRYYKFRLPPLPKVPLTREQRNAIKDPSEILADQYGNQKIFKPQR